MKSQKEIAMMNYGLWSDMENTTISDLNFHLVQNVLKRSEKLRVSLDYLRRDFDFFNRSEIFPLDEIERIHVLQLNLDFHQNLGSSYQIDASLSPTISSSWTNALTSEDFLWNFSGFISKKWMNAKNASHSLYVGVLYDVLLGSPRYIPSLQYQTTVLKRTRLDIGFPKNSVAFQFNERNQVMLEYTFSGMYAHVSNSLQIDGVGDIVNAKFVQNGSELTLGYDFRIQPNFTTSSKLGYQFINEYEIQDSFGNQLYDFGRGFSPYFSMGIKYNFK